MRLDDHRFGKKARAEAEAGLAAAGITGATSAPPTSVATA